MDSRLIVALDLADSAKVIQIGKKLAPEVFAIKVQWITVMDKGIYFVRELSKVTKVLCDFKVADIPFTNSNITRSAMESGAWGIISHSFLGRDSLSAVVKSAENMKVFSVVGMSHPGYSEVMEGKMDELIKISLDCGVYGLIAPGNNYYMLRKIREQTPTLKIAATGVGVQGGSAVEAINSGADYIIVGRSIYEAQDPLNAARKINEDIGTALQKLV